MSKDSRFREVFYNGMKHHSTIVTKKILEIYQGFSGISTLVDVGGATGDTISLVVSKMYPLILEDEIQVYKKTTLEVDFLKKTIVIFIISTTNMVSKMTLLAILVSLAFGIVSGRSHFGQQVTIKANNGQIYNCVDFNKQPAFANHSLNLQVVPNLAKLQQQQSASDFGLDGRRCPIGTVPIMVRSKQNDDGFVVPKPRSLPHAVENRDLHCSAKFQTKGNNPNKKFFGVHGIINVFKPLVQSSQWSSARVKLLNGAESIEAGWMVNPKEFKDNEAHLYASFSVGGKRCINMDCPSFVQVSNAVPLGVASPNYSVLGGVQFGWGISINKHQDDGNWWLTVGRVKVGYWPKNLFTTLKDVANQVDFGGEIDDPGMVNPPPAMGNGRQAITDTRESSYIYQVTVVDERFNNVNPSDTESFEDCNLLYTVTDYYDNSAGRIIFYGGPVWTGI